MSIESCIEFLKERAIVDDIRASMMQENPREEYAEIIGYLQNQELWHKIAGEQVSRLRALLRTCKLYITGEVQYDGAEEERLIQEIKDELGGW